MKSELGSINVSIDLWDVMGGGAAVTSAWMSGTERDFDCQGLTVTEHKSLLFKDTLLKNSGKRDCYVTLAHMACTELRLKNDKNSSEAATKSAIYGRIPLRNLFSRVRRLSTQNWIISRSFDPHFRLNRQPRARRLIFTAPFSRSQLAQPVLQSPLLITMIRLKFKLSSISDGNWIKITPRDRGRHVPVNTQAVG